MSRVSGLRLSISATTRSRRVSEKDGREYFFLGEREFKEWVDAGHFLEWAEYAGHLYGTPARAVQDSLQAGLGVILEIELKGASQVLAKCPEAIMLYIMPPSLDELERRLRGRRTESEQAIKARLARAKEEMATVREKEQRGLPPLHYVIVNDSVKRASDELAGIIERIREEDEQADGR